MVLLNANNFENVNSLSEKSAQDLEIGACLLLLEAYSETCQTSSMACFAK